VLSALAVVVVFALVAGAIVAAIEDERADSAAHQTRAQRKERQG
jgi:hypothetical protein